MLKGDGRMSRVLRFCGGEGLFNERRFWIVMRGVKGVVIFAKSAFPHVQ